VLHFYVFTHLFIMMPSCKHLSTILTVKNGEKTLFEGFRWKHQIRAPSHEILVVLCQ